jgi:hypothetical protein
MTNEIQSMPVAEISLHRHSEQLPGPLLFWGHAEVRNVWTLLHTSLSCIMINLHGQLYFGFIERARTKATVVQSCSEGHNPTMGKK